MGKTKDYGTLRRHVGAIPFEIIMAGSAAALLWMGNYVHAWVALFTFAVSFAPLFIERIWRVRVASFLQATYVAFVFLSMYAGEVLGMYEQVAVWDDSMHLLSGILIGGSAVVWLVTAIHRHRLHLPTWLQTVYVFCVGAATAVLWEVLEFSSDSLFGTSTQRNDLTDTMTDLMYGMGSALVIAVLFFRFLNRQPSLGLDRIIAHSKHLNR